MAAGGVEEVGRDGNGWQQTAALGRQLSAINIKDISIATAKGMRGVDVKRLWIMSAVVDAADRVALIFSWRGHRAKITAHNISSGIAAPSKR